MVNNINKTNYYLSSQLNERDDIKVELQDLVWNSHKNVEMD